MSAARSLVVTVLLAGLAVGCAGGQTDGPDLAAGADHWTTVEHGGTSAALPPGWVELDTSACEFEAIRYGPPDEDPCDPESQLGFYYDATFDPADGPGARPAGDGWAGYARGDEYAVYVAAPGRDVVRRVLSSVGP
jgi:hypothetical protein